MTGQQNLLAAGERLDDLIINNLKIIQRPDQFRFSLDAVLLAHFATVRKGASAVDLGTGTGVIALLLTALGAGKVTGIEINPCLAEMAGRSAALNNLAAQVEIIAGDLRKVKGILPAGGYDLVVSNPPYRRTQSGKYSPNDMVAIARHEITATLQDVVRAANHLLKYRGRFALVHLPERLAEILAVLAEAGLEPKRLQLVHPYVDKKPTMVLVEAVRGANPGLDVLPPLVIYNANGTYSRQIRQYYLKPEESGVVSSER